MYKRVLLKLSGEQLAGSHQHGIDTELAGWLADQVQEVVKNGTQVVIVVGGGNFVRGAEMVGHGIQRVTADHMGMLSILINVLALTDIFESRGVPTRCLSNIYAEQVVEPFVYRIALKHLEKNRVLIIAGGIGSYLTSDTAAVRTGLELDCEVVMKATKVDGVYDSDPVVNSNATKFAKLTYREAIENDAIKVMDKAAMGLALEHHMPLLVFDALKPQKILKASRGEPIGTLVS